MRRKKRTVLVVDDEEAIRGLLRAALADEYEVVTAVDGGDAMQHLQENVDLVVSDITMPCMSGIEFAQQWKSARPETPILLMTGFPDLASTAGIRGYLVIRKPFVINQMRDAIKQLLDRPISRVAQAE